MLFTLVRAGSTINTADLCFAHDLPSRLSVLLSTSVIVYAFCAHWVFAENGWLRQMGMHDFAGGGPVHLLGGVNGLVAILMVGPRKGRFDGSRPDSDFEPSSPTNILFGLFMLWWGCKFCF